MNNPPPDVIFAQKATAIVKAAGMDPRSIDLEKFRLNASLVFSRAYSAIYKERLPSLLNEKSTKDEKILNSQLVLDGLFAKTRNPVLLQLTGNEIYQGNHKAIGVLVGILFAEGQRLWLEKIRAVEAQAQAPVLESSADFDQSHRLQEANDMLNRDEEVNSLNDDDLNKRDGFDGQDIRSSLKTLHKLRSNPEIGPVDLERLLSRIAFLEEQLQRKTVKKSKSGSHKGTRSSKKNVGNRIADAILRDNEINQRLFDESSGEGAFQTTNSASGKDKQTEERREYARTSASSRSPTLRRPMSGNGMGIAEVRKSRPTSAPSTSNRKVNKIRHPSNRLYSAAPSRHREAEATEAPAERARVRSGRNQTPEPAASNQVVKEKDIFDPSIHTYDWKSGRKILIAQAQAEYEERKRNKEAMDNILALSDTAVDALMGGDHSRPTSPVKAEYPSKSISGDVDKWLQRMRRDRYGERKAPPKVEDVQMPEPRYFAAYQKLEDRDLVITIEHCYNCQHHNVTTRHKQDDYVNNSSSFLRALAQMAHESGVCARVGVSRFKANVTEKCSTSDSDSRIGAFEIQVAYKGPNGKVVPKILHSKLMTRCWPSKNVLEKRFRAFIASAKVSTMHPDSDTSSSSVHMAHDSTEPYPVGASSWIMSPVANPAWSFALNEVQQAAGSNAPLITGPSATSAQLTANAIPSVQWAFDMRELSESPPKFAVGSTIRVNKLQYSSGCVERHALLAVVKDYADPNDPHASDVIVKPMYQAQEVRVPQRNCVNLSHCSEERAADFSSGEVPIELQVLFLLAKQNKMFAWDVARGEGRKEANGDMCLSRKAFYNQVRKLAWALEKKLAARGKYLLAHPESGEEVDIQFCYSEIVMDWVFETFKGEANVTALERLASQPAAVPQTPSTKSPSSKQNSAVAGSTGNSVNPTPRSESHPSNTGNNTARTASVPPAQPPNSARTATTAESNTPQLFGTVVEVDDSTQPGQPGEETAQHEDPQLSPGAESRNENAAHVEQEPSALTMESEFEQTAPPSFTAAEPQLSARSAKNDTASLDPPASSAVNPPVSAQTPPVSSRATDGHSSQSAEAEASTNEPSATQAPPPTPATIAEGTSASPAAPTSDSNTASTSKPVSKSSTLPSKRFSSADLVGAADQALKNKVITALCLPGQAHDPALTAMERMSILYQLADVLLDEAVLESDEKAELSQGPFLTILRTYGLSSLLDNPSVAGALLAKANTSSSTPDKPAAVELFMNWLQAGDSVKRRTASALEKSKSEPAVAVVPSSTGEPTGAVREEEEDSPLAASIELPAESVLASPSPVQLPSTPANTEASSTGVTEAKTASAKSSPRGEIASTSQPNSVRSLGGTAAPTARSTASPDDAETALRKQEEYQKSLNYQPKEMQFSTLVIEGDQLVHAFYDTVMVQVKIGKDQWTATTCMPREKGSKRRTFAVKWPEFIVAADTFRDDALFFTVAVSDSAVTTTNPAVPSLATTTLGESANSVKIPLYLFMLPTFDVQREVSVTPVVVAKSGAPPSSGTIKVTIHGHARDPKGLRTARIMSMRPQDLMNIKFDPILPLDDGDEDIYESDDESDTEDSPVKKKATTTTAAESPKDAQHDDELTRTLYPKASVQHMVTASAPMAAENVLTITVNAEMT